MKKEKNQKVLYRHEKKKSPLVQSRVLEELQGFLKGFVGWGLGLKHSCGVFKSSVVGFSNEVSRGSASGVEGSAGMFSRMFKGSGHTHGF